MGPPNMAALRTMVSFLRWEPTAPVILTCIFSRQRPVTFIPTAMELFRTLVCFCWATLYMARLNTAGVRVMALSLRSILTEQVLQICMFLSVIPLTEKVLAPDCFDLAKACTGRLLLEARQRTAPFSSSTPMAGVLPTCTISRQLLVRFIPTLTEIRHMPS